MAHEIEGNSVFSVKETMWHGLGTVLENAPSVKEAIVYAGLDWDVAIEDSYKANVSLNGIEYVSVPETKYVVRATDNKVLGTVGKKYEVIQNRDAFQWFQPFLDTGLVELETAGCLAGGKRIWIMAKFVGDPVVIKGQDVIQKYILLANSHDGSMAITTGLTPQRVVCQNTLSMADNDNSSQLLRIRHTQAAHETLIKAREIIDITNRAFEATVEQYKFLASRVVNTEQLDKFVKIVLKKDNEEEIGTRSKNTIDEIKALFEHGKGNDMSEIKGTAWAMYNAYTEYLSHESGNSLDSRYKSLWFGQGKNKNKLALETALQMVR